MVNNLKVWKEYIKFLNADDNSVLNHQNSMFENKYEHVKFMIDILKSIKKNKNNLSSYADLATGTGDLPYWVSKENLFKKIFAIDAYPSFIQSMKMNSKLHKHGIQIIHQDMFKNHRYNFDVITNCKTMMLYENLEEYIENILSFVKPGGCVIITSLFNESDVDIIARFKDYTRESGQKGIWFNYCCFSIKRTERVLKEKFGLNKICFHDFQISIPIRKLSDGLGTYTIETNDGKYLEFSAGFYMNWKFLEIWKPK